MVHGWGGSFRRTWKEVGWVDLLRDGGREVIGVDLRGHGDNPSKSHDPEDYTDLTGDILDAIDGHEVIDAVGFSLGALTLLELACRQPGRFGRLVLCGIGRNVVDPQPVTSTSIVDALEGTGDPDDLTAQLFVQYANQPGNDLAALTACMKGIRPRITPERLSAVTCPVLVVIGDKDFAGPGEPLAAALPDARLVTLRNVDHFALTEEFKCIDAVLEFLDALP